MPRRRGLNDDDFIHAVDQHYLRLGLGAAVLAAAAADRDLTKARGGDETMGCARHTSRQECIGSAAMQALAAMGLEIMPGELLDAADSAMAAAVDGGNVIIRPRAPTMFDVMRHRVPN